jgi:hypothetical protein
MTRVLLLVAVMVVPVSLLSLLACSKDDPPPAPAVPASAPITPPSTAAAPVSAALSASAVPSASASDVASATASSVPSTAVSVKVATATSTAKPAPTCGDKPLPPCPLAKWMKANTSAAMSSQDFDGLATALDKVVGFAPAGYGNWASISRDGADAARAQSLDGVKASCRSCHNQYKDRYKKELRDRPI